MTDSDFRVTRSEFEREIQEAIATYGAESATTEAIAFSDGAEWAIAWMNGEIDNER